MLSSSPESWKARRARATSATVSGSRSSSAVSSRPSMKRVTRQGGSSMKAATGGAIPSSAARLFAVHSASRSMPSRPVSLPGRRST